MELTRERFAVVIASGVLLVSSGLYLFLYGPLMNQLRKKTLEAKTIEAEVFQTRAGIESFKAADIKKTFVTEQEISLAIDELTRQGKAQGMNFVFVSSTPKAIEKPPDSLYRILPVEMETESSYESLGQFLGSLDDLEKYLVTVRSFSVISDKDEPSRVSTQLTVNLYLEGSNRGE